MVQTDSPILLHNLKIPPMSAWCPEHDKHQPPASNLDVTSEDESEAEHSHVLPKGIFPSHSESFLIAYNQFSFSLKEISCCAIR